MSLVRTESNARMRQRGGHKGNPSPSAVEQGHYKQAKCAPKARFKSLTRDLGFRSGCRTNEDDDCHLKMSSLAICSVLVQIGLYGSLEAFSRCAHDTRADLSAVTPRDADIHGR